LPDPAATAAWKQADTVAQTRTTGGPPQKSPAELAFDRRLGGPVFAHQSERTPAQSSAATPSSPAALTPFSSMAFGQMTPSGSADRKEDGASLGSLLRPSVMPAVEARLLPTREFLLGKGTAVDCTLETAIDSTLPGMTTCITATDTFSVDGRIVLLERGTKLVGETRGQVQQGASRLFVLWVEARTPTGVVVPLASPGTDELGRAGLSGQVNRHFWDRFGAAILISIIDGGVQAASRSRQGSSVIVNPSTSSDVLTEVLRGTVSIPPTITKPQGDRIEVLAARDVDFRPVYELRSVATVGFSEGSP
jgi:type IV secretion system protein VirB10